MYYDVILWKYKKNEYIEDRKISFPNNDMIINDDDTINILYKKLCVYFNLKNIYIWCTYETSDDYIIYDFINNVFKLNNKIDYLYFNECAKNYFKDIKLRSYEENFYISKDDAFRMLNEKNDKFTITIPLQFKYVSNNFFEPLSYNPLTTTLNTDIFKGYNINNHNFNTIEYLLSNIKPIYSK